MSGTGNSQSKFSNWANTPRLGTFLGVFTPTILTILGVILYLRFGWVLGQVGLFKTILIVLLAHLITIITTLCLSAVATNSRVGVGGAYFMISRSLGVEIGAAIGFPLFLSQAFSVTLYSFGLAESFRFIWPDLPVAPSAFIVIILVALISLRGAGFALKSQIPVMVLIALSLIMLIAGVAVNAPLVSPGDILADETSFWLVFAVFFPAVTGIMAGLSLSGDLTNSRKSIPQGTILAVLIGLVVYLLVLVLLTIGADATALRQNQLIWADLALFGPWVILPGLWGAIFSSAIGSMLGAPRTLQALAMDRVVPRWIGRKSGAQGEPVVGLFVTLSLSLLAVFLGSLNAVATLVTLFFLSVYGTVNLVAGLEQLSGNPSWRPTIDVHWGVSFVGAFGCFGVMFLINLPVTLVVVSVELSLWLILKRRVQREAWGDVWRDLYVALVRWAMIRLVRRPLTARNWRPHVLVFTSSVEKRLDLARFGVWFSGGRGVVTVSEMIEGNILDLDIDILYRQKQIDTVLKNEGITAFGVVNIVQNIERGVLTVAQASGLAGLQSNTLLLGWPDDKARLAHFLGLTRRLSRLNRSLVIGKIDRLPLPQEGRQRRIDVWWGGLRRNGDLMLLLAYLLTQNPEWEGTKIRILSVASNLLMQQQTESFLAQLIPEIRIDAEVKVLSRVDGLTVQALMQQESADADLVLLGLASPEEGEEEEYAKRLFEMTTHLPSCFFIHNGSLFIGDLVTPELQQTESVGEEIAEKHSVAPVQNGETQEE